ncbi:MAG TPA: putative toxin-antitoxin system toxin component, PIN family [Patescibacteria group bacterium]|nr:putative toxin-antitoxin system toxin component, PIN family [Patescibacteria group bacterium]
MRILYDTNVLVGMLSRRESILAFKRLIELDEMVHISSGHLLGEVEAVLVEKMGLTRQKAKAAARLLERQSVIVHPVKIEKICRDPFDDYVLAAAIAGKSDYLVTADKDLLVLEKHKKVAIITPREFTAIVKSSGQ